jgi:SsrA-binding protein
MARKKKEAQPRANPERKTICRNKRALHDYFIEDRMEAGLALRGTEVKSLRDGGASLSDAYAELRRGELFLINSHINPYGHATFLNHDTRRPRKLLLHKREIARLAIKLNERGFTLVPLELYFSRGKAKVELGLAKGKKQHDKRETLRERDQARELEVRLGRRR